jgi:hypothetical protein
MARTGRAFLIPLFESYAKGDVSKPASAQSLNVARRVHIDPHRLDLAAEPHDEPGAGEEAGGLFVYQRAYLERVTTPLQPNIEDAFPPCLWHRSSHLAASRAAVVKKTFELGEEVRERRLAETIERRAM